MHPLQLFPAPELTPAQIERRDKTIALVGKITDHVNTMSGKDETFLKAMSVEHRTLQQSFTRLCLQWLEHTASEDYRFDARNDASHVVSKGLIQQFENEHNGYKPSQFLPFI